MLHMRMVAIRQHRPRTERVDCSQVAATQPVHKATTSTIVNAQKGWPAAHSKRAASDKTPSIAKNALVRRIATRVPRLAPVIRTNTIAPTHARRISATGNDPAIRKRMFAATTVQRAPPHRSEEHTSELQSL